MLLWGMGDISRWNTVWWYQVSSSNEIYSYPVYFIQFYPHLRWNNIDSFQFRSCFIAITSKMRTTKLTYDLNSKNGGCYINKPYIVPTIC